jgi:signal transduction histidine kinase
MPMRFFRDIPLKQKLLATILLTLSLASVLSLIGVMVVDTRLFRLFLNRDLEALARMTADTSTAALAFDDAKTAAETLAALKAKTHMVAARIYRRDGSVLASYTRPGAAGFDLAMTGEHDVAGDAVTVTQPVLLNGRQVGTVVMRYDLGEVSARRQLYGGVVGIVLLGSALIALMLSWRFQKAILQPIASLTSAARSISETKDYGIRVGKLSRDELGFLSDAFNEMLFNIQSRDVELRRAHEELEQRVQARTQELARSNADLQQFAYVASHDLQEPLRMVISYLQILADRYRGQLDADADEFIGYAVDGGYRMRQLITDLLEYSRVGTRSLEAGPTDCNVVLEDVRANLDLAIRESSAEITCDPEGLPTIMADPSHVLQIFQNLISNAIKFRGPRPARIHISARRDGSSWLFSVADQGIGIDPDHKDAIFEIFRRLHDRMEYPGTGIGLAVCKKIVDRLGGRIWVESEPGKGSTFFFSIGFFSVGGVGEGKHEYKADRKAPGDLTGGR